MYTMVRWLTCIFALVATQSSAIAAPFIASRAGARLDSNLSSGGGTDDTKALQTILNRAADGRAVHLIVDGPALVSGLDVYSQR